MNKTAIKNYAVWARVALIEAVKQRAYQYGITEKDSADPNADSVNGFVLTPSEKQQRQALIGKIREKGYEQVCEEAAYTWFNRFAALRFMEVNGYLPSRVRVFTDEQNAFKPQILAEAMHLELDGLNLDRVIALTEKNKTDELYKYLLITQCNALNVVLPGMFQKIHDYTELLFPDNLLREGSVIERMIAMIPEEDWTDQVQIIGWLYQFYNTEPKDKVFADLKKNIKIGKDKIPAATQVFTPDWIVRYMVENSLGRLWVEGHPNDKMKASWKYYLEEAEQEPEVQVQLAEIRKGYASLKPTDIKVIDPCCGSGHILCYLFDVLMQIYEDSGYAARDAAQSILLYNLWGLDIDERAAQLSYFAVMMKARQYDRRFFSRNIQPHVLAIAESNAIDREALDYFCKDDTGLKKAIQTVIAELHDSKEYGSILTCSKQDWDALYGRFGDIYDDISMYRDEALALQPLVQTAEALSQQYDVVVTNPPYRGIGDVADILQEYVKKNYPRSKQDLSTVFMEKCRMLCNDHGMYSMINIPVWMLLTSFTDLRSYIYKNSTIVNLTHLGRGVFGSDFGTVAFVISSAYVNGYKGVFKRLFERAGDVEPEEIKMDRFFSPKSTYYSGSSSFSKIPGKRLAYWASEQNAIAYQNNMPLSEYADVKKGMSTADDQRFLRLWHEISILRFASFTEENPKWFRINKGGSFRRWYGNNEYVVDWLDNGAAMKSFSKAVIRNESYYFRPFGLTWTYVTNYKLNVRYYENAAFAAVGPGIFPKGIEWQYLLGFLNTKVAQLFANNVGGESITYEVGEVASIPIAKPIQGKMADVVRLVDESVELSKNDWDSFESSWDFKRHPLVVNSIACAIGAEHSKQYAVRIRDCFIAWNKECSDRFVQLKANEEELNRIFIEIYGLQDELEPEVEEKDVTVRKADLQREIKSLISYAVGCMFGRYSLDVDGLCCAGGEWTASKYETIIPDRDNILPITDDEYFEDDIVTRFVKFVEVVYGAETLEENLKFIAVALGGKGTPRQVIRNYFLNEFYPDHLKVYQKRPIYWLFDSGKKSGFKCLIYMHRYQPDTLARIRTDYVHELQSRYRTAIEDLNDRVETASPAERVKLSKQLQKLQAQEDELRVYEEKIHHLADQMIAIDLDDGVKVNYAKFEDVLAKIK